jgi:hypothetical protein
MLQQTTKVQEEWQERSLTMLGIIDNFTALLLLPDDATIACDICGQEAFIFQEEGNLLLGLLSGRNRARDLVTLLLHLVQTLSHCSL